MKILSVVCARAGSKGLKNKCVAKINGKMVAEYAIEYSLSLGDDVKTAVSTDIDSLIEHCIKNGISYIRRDSAFCADESRIDDALAEAIGKEGEGCDYCSLVYGNIPIRYPVLFQQALDFLKNNDDYDAVITMQNVEKFHPEWMLDLNSNIMPKVKESDYRRQALSPKMIHDGHTLIFKIDGFLNRYNGLVPYEAGYLYSIFGAKIKPLINDRLIVDIDTARDLELAEAILDKKTKFQKDFTKAK